MLTKPPKVFILDVDGVLTDGHFIYSSRGKMYKIFGPDDNDALGLLKNMLEIRFVTGDVKGFKISRKRIVDDMGYKLDLVSTYKRKDWIGKRYQLSEVIYMGDGIFDHYVLSSVRYGICPANSHWLAKKYANHITLCSGGDRAVAEACLHIMNIFFNNFDEYEYPDKYFPSLSDITT